MFARMRRRWLFSPASFLARVHQSVPKKREAVVLLQILCVLSVRQILVGAHTCDVGQEKDSDMVWRWVLPYEDPCACTSVRFGGLNTETPERPFSPVYVDNPLISKDIQKIRAHYGLQCKDINECESDPCQKGGECVDGVNSYTCECPIGYAGETCEININECESGPCQNGGECVDGVNSYTCECPSGYAGDTCEMNINECESDPCQNGGECVDGVNSYTCQCLSGYAGDNCETDINECESDPCQNGGECVDGVNSYTCECPSGYAGETCDMNINECESDPCQNGGECVDGVNSYTCECPSGYAGETCEMNQRRLVFKAVSGKHGGDNDPGPYQIYDNPGGLHEDNAQAKQLNVSYQGHYKSAHIDDWQTLDVQEVQLVLYDATGVELFKMTFNGIDSTKYDWMSLDRLTYAQYTDIRTETITHFSIRDWCCGRWFFIDRNVAGGCGTDAGWLGVVQGSDCDYETRQGYKPVFLYSKLDTIAAWNTVEDVGEADIFAIYIITA